MSTIQLSRQGIRLRADERSRDPLLDFYTGATPQGWARASTQFEVGLASRGSLVDVSNLSSVTLQATPYTDRGGTRLFSQTLAGGALDNTLTEPTWDDGSQQHALFVFEQAAMNILGAGVGSLDVWLIITALTAAGEQIVCGTGKMTFNDDGAFNDAASPPANDGAAITVGDADARYILQAGGVNRIPAVTGLTGSGASHLDGIASANLPSYYAVMVRNTATGSNVYQLHVLEPVTDAVNGAVETAPGDFNGTRNNRRWRQRM